MQVAHMKHYVLMKIITQGLIILHWGVPSKNSNQSGCNKQTNLEIKINKTQRKSVAEK